MCDVTEQKQGLKNTIINGCNKVLPPVQDWWNEEEQTREHNNYLKESGTHKEDYHEDENEIENIEYGPKRQKVSSASAEKGPNKMMDSNSINIIPLRQVRWFVHTQIQNIKEFPDMMFSCYVKINKYSHSSLAR